MNPPSDPSTAAVTAVSASATDGCAPSRIWRALPRPIRNRLQPTSVGARLARATIWSTVGICVSRSLSLVTFIVVARILGKASFGEWGILRATVAGFQILAGFGLGDTVTRHVACHRHADPVRAGRVVAVTSLAILGTSAAAATLLVLLAPWLASHTLAAPHLAHELRVCGGMVFLLGVQAWQGGVLSGLEAFRAISKIEIFGGMGSFLLTVAGASLAGLAGAMWGMLAGSVLRSIAAHLVLRAETARYGIRPTVHCCFSQIGVLWQTALPVFLASAVAGPAMWLVQAFLVNRPDGYRAMAEFTAAQQWRLALGALPGLLCAGYLPVAASLRSEPARQRRLTLRVAGICGMAAFAAIIPLALLSGPILAAYGPGFASARPALLVMFGLAVIDSIDMVLWAALLAAGRAWWRPICNGLWMACIAASTLLLVPSHGALGLALALLLAQALHLIIQVPMTLVALPQQTPRGPVAELPTR